MTGMYSLIMYAMEDIAYIKMDIAMDVRNGYIVILERESERTNEKKGIRVPAFCCIADVKY